MADEPRDYSREAAHKRYSKAQEIAAENPDVGLDEALGELYWNTEWEPGVPTHQEVQDNWDYYKQLTNNGQISLSQLFGQQEGQQANTQPDQGPTDEPEGRIAESLSDKVKNVGTKVSEQVGKTQDKTPETLKNDVKATVDRVMSGSPVNMQPQSVDMSSAEPQSLDAAVGAVGSSVVIPNNANNQDSGYGKEDNRNDLSPSIERGTSSSYSDQERMRELQQQVLDEQAKNLEHAKQAEELKYIADHGLAWSNPYDDPNFQSDIDNIRNADTASPLAFDMQRRIFDSSGNLDNPLNWDIFGFSSQKKSSDATRRLYEYGFANDKGTTTPYVPLNNEVVDRRMIDDGYSPESREGIYMTGDQYIKYRTQFGIPGRDVDDIIPNALYSKQNEMNEYGFVPYIVSGQGMDSFHNEASAQALNQAFNDFSNLRRNNSDFNVNLDGETYSGKDFINSFNKQGENLQAQMQDPSNYTVVPNGSPLVNSLSQPIDGVINYKTGQVKKGFTIDDVEADFDNGILTFPDGTTWSFDDPSYINDHFSEDGSGALKWYTPDPSKFDSVKLSNGSVIDGVRAMDIMTQISEGRGDNIDYGEFNWGKQNPSLPEDLLNVDQWGDFLSSGEYAPWFADMVLGSLPFFKMETGVPRGLGRAATELHGVSPDRNDYNGTYSLISENPTKDQAVSQAIGSAGLPFTEHIWGPLGGRALGTVFPKVLGENVVKAWNPAKRYVSDVIGEGLEELPGDFFENLERSGWKDLYANQDPGMYDSQGRPIYLNTDFPTRVINHVKSWPESFIGGATLGAAFGLPNIPYNIVDYNNYKKVIDKYGDDVDASKVKPGRNLTEQEIRRYNR